MPFPFAAVATGLGTALNFFSQSDNSAREAEMAKYNTDQTIKANKDAANLAYQRDMEQWNRANHYNNPTQSMARLKAAGLNPMLAYGTPNQAGSSPQMGRPTADYQYKARLTPQLDVGGTAQTIQNLQLGKAQIDNVKANTDATRQTTALSAIKTALAEIDRVYADRKRSADTKISETNAEFLTREKLMKLLMEGTQNSLMQQNQTQSREMFQYDLQFKKGSIQKQEQETKELLERIKGYPLSRVQSEVQTNKMRAETGLVDENIRKNQLEQVLLDKDRLIKEWEIFLNQGGTHKGDTPWGQVTRRGSVAFEQFVKWLENKYKQ